MRPEFDTARLHRELDTSVPELAFRKRERTVLHWISPRGHRERSGRYTTRRDESVRCATLAQPLTAARFVSTQNYVGSDDYRPYEIGPRISPICSAPTLGSSIPTCTAVTIVRAVSSLDRRLSISSAASFNPPRPVELPGQSRSRSTMSLVTLVLVRGAA